MQSSFHIRGGRKPGLYNEASTSSTTASGINNHTGSPSSPRPSDWLPTPRLPSAFPTSPLLKASSLKRARVTSSTTPMSVLASPVIPSATLAPPSASSSSSTKDHHRYAELAGSVPSTPTRPSSSRQPSRSERMLRATLGTSISLLLLSISDRSSMLTPVLSAWIHLTFQRPGPICLEHIENPPSPVPPTRFLRPILIIFLPLDLKPCIHIVAVFVETRVSSL